LQQIKKHWRQKMNSNPLQKHIIKDLKRMSELRGEYELSRYYNRHEKKSANTKSGRRQCRLCKMFFPIEKTVQVQYADQKKRICLKCKATKFRG
jgi:hypothetical protein